MPRSSALAALGSHGLGAATAGSGLWGPLPAAGMALLGEQTRQKQPGPWDARPTPAGWRLPRNPSRTPVRPGGAFQVEQTTDDLGPLQVVSTMAGRIRALRLHWPETFVEPAFSAQKAVFLDLLTRLAPDVTLHVVAEGLGECALRRLLQRWHAPRPERVHIYPLGLHSTPARLCCPLTLWARDGAILVRAGDGRQLLLLPSSFRGDGQVDAGLNRVVVQGSGAAPASLQQAVPELVVRRSQLSFEGGDVIASHRAVLLGGDSLARTMRDLRLPRKAAIELFEKELGLPVVVISPQPEFHLDLGFTFLDDDTVAVADPAGTIRLAEASADPQLHRLAGVTRDRRLAELYDKATTGLREAGFRVVRLPNLCGVGLQTPYITYNNVLLENYVEAETTVKRVFMPVYGVDALDRAARALYAEHGYRVVDMPSARLSTRLWGAIRCATGELRVDAPVT